MSRLLDENDSTLDSREAEYMLGLYAKHLALLQQHEGRDFDIAHASYRMCLRIFQFIMASLYDFPGALIGLLQMPDEIRELV